MRISTSDQTRQEAIAKWLSGWPRDKIAGELGIGAGTVTNIIANWTNEVGTPTAASLRELSVELRRAGMGIRDCARGLRIMRILSSRMGDDEISQIELFVNKVYNKCKYLNLSPDHLVEIASEIWELSKIMPTSHISTYLNEKLKEKESLEAEIRKINKERDLAEVNYKKSLYRSNITAQALEDYEMVRAYLSGYGLGTADLHKLMLALQNVEKYGFDIDQIMKKISNNQSLADEELDLRKKLALGREELEATKNTSKVLEMDMEQNAIKISYYNDLSSLGFGLEEMKSLKNALVEIAEAKNSGSSASNPADTVKLFFKRLEEYGDLEARIKSLKEEKNGIEEARNLLINEMKDFIGQTKKEVKEMSNIAIEAIGIASKRNTSDSAQDTT
ncbi:MAG: helix-turn-helix domain-containing protein [Nitrososphaeraceae archaeon]